MIRGMRNSTPVSCEDSTVCGANKPGQSEARGKFGHCLGPPVLSKAFPFLLGFLGLSSPAFSATCTAGSSIWEDLNHHTARGWRLSEASSQFRRIWPALSMRIDAVSVVLGILWKEQNGTQ